MYTPASSTIVPVAESNGAEYIPTFSEDPKWCRVVALFFMSNLSFVDYLSVSNMEGQPANYLSEDALPRDTYTSGITYLITKGKKVHSDAYVHTLVNAIGRDLILLTNCCILHQ